MRILDRTPAARGSGRGEREKAFLGPPNSLGALYASIMSSTTTIALGIDLHFVSTAEGGRSTVLLGGNSPDHRFEYRPNWGLPGWVDGQQSAGPILGFSRTNIRPGDDVRAVLVPLFIETTWEWQDVQVGDNLRMYEGARICGRGIIRWIESSTWPMGNEDQGRFTEWLIAGDV